MRRYLLSIAVFGAATLLSTSPALADEPYAVTPSGATEAYFAMRVVDTSDYLANQCLDLGWTMVSSTETTVVCEVPMSFGQKLLGALAGPRYATPPRQYFRFNLAGARGHTRVQATSWQETQTAFGQTQRTDLASDNYHNTVMNFFQNAGGALPPGTKFPNHANPGFAAESVEVPQDGMRITELISGAAAERSGLQVGDVITRLAGERIKDTDDLLDGLHKAARQQSYEVQLYRNGEQLKLALPLTFREPAGDLADVALEQETVVANASAIQASPPMSVADELAKFVQLRDQRIISEEEFQEQKGRLLAQ